MCLPATPALVTPGLACLPACLQILQPNMRRSLEEQMRIKYDEAGQRYVCVWGGGGGGFGVRVFK